MRFAGKTVIVTGAAGNLGSAVAKKFAEEGASVALFGHRLEKVEAVANELAGNHAAFGVDLTDREATKNAIADVAEKLGPPDIVCAIAGGFDMGTPVHEVPGEDWQKMMDRNLGTLLSVLAAVTPGMIERGAGKIVTIGANGAKTGGKTMGPYAASKSAVMREEPWHQCQFGTAVDHRHAGKPRCDAEGRSGQMGDAGKPRRGHRLPVLGRCEGYPRRAGAGNGAELAAFTQHGFSTEGA